MLACSFLMWKQRLARATSCLREALHFECKRALRFLSLAILGQDEFLQIDGSSCAQFSIDIICTRPRVFVQLANISFEEKTESCWDRLKPCGVLDLQA